MAFERPTLSEIVSRAASDISTRLIGTVAALRRSVIRAIASSIGGAAHEFYGYLDFMAKQYFEDTAEAEYLERKAFIWNVTRNAATFAEGEVNFVGTVNGSVMSAGSILQRSDGVEYSVNEDAVLSSLALTASVTCRTAGDTGNMLAGETLTLVTPIAGITSAGTVGVDGLTNGADEESDDNLRDRLLAVIRNAPRGGNAADYEAWAKEVTGVTRVWVYENQYGTGTVGLTFVRDGETPIIPSAGEVLAVQAHLDEVRPLTADLTVWAPTALPLNFTIHLTPDTAAIRTAVQAELTDLINRVAEPGGIIYLSQIREAVSSASGEVDSVVTVPAANADAPDGSLYTMGVITWA